MTRLRAFAHAAVLFLGITGSMIPMGAAVFEESVPLATYGTGAAAGAGWLALGTDRSRRERS